MRNKKQKSEISVQKFRKLIFPLFIFSIAFASYAFGSGGGEEGEHGSILRDYMWKIFNFAILIIILFKFARKPLQNFLQKRTELIEKTLNEAREAKEAATKALKEVEERLKLKDAELEAILTAAKKSGEHDRDNIIEESARLKHAKEAIKAEAAEIAIELAEKKLKEKLTKEEQEKLLEESITKIGGSN